MIIREGPDDKVTLSKALKEVREKVTWLHWKSFQVERKAYKGPGGGRAHVFGVEKGKEGGREENFCSEMHRHVSTFPSPCVYFYRKANRV